MTEQEKSNKSQSEMNERTQRENNETVISAKDGNNQKPVTDVLHKDISILMEPGSEKRQSMEGFDNDYVDIIWTILSVTLTKSGKRAASG
jgi:hypothetical protein